MFAQQQQPMKHTHIVAIDGLRAVAALSVFLQHLLQQFAPGQFPNSLGWAGVTLFFLLSGFCIHYPQAQSRQTGRHGLDIGQFGKRRLLRIFPAYFAALLISCWVGQYHPSNLVGPYHGLDDFWMHVFFVHNLRPETFYSINAVFWSIAIEIQFYLIYAFFYRQFRFTLKECALFFCIGLAWYFAVSVAVAEPWRGLLQRSFVSTFWIWHLGAVMATLFVRKESHVSKANYGLVLLASVLVLIWDPVIFRLHIIYWFGPLVLAVFIWKTFAFKTPNALNHVGRISYSLYLFHPVAIALVMGWAFVYPQSWAILLGLALATTGYYALESPFIALSKRKVSNS